MTIWSWFSDDHDCTKRKLKKAGARLATLNNEAVWGKFAVDSPLEGSGFELSVPRQVGNDFDASPG